MDGTLAITDKGWYDLLRSQPDLTEVNFWKPSAHRAWPRQHQTTSNAPRPPPSTPTYAPTCSRYTSSSRSIAAVTL